MRLKKDWRNPDDYRFDDSLPNHLWAWEFLRRNKEYQQDWELALKEYLARFDGHDDHTFPIDGPNFHIHSDEAEDKWQLSGGYINPQNDTPEELRFYDFDLWACEGGLPISEKNSEGYKEYCVSLKEGHVLIKFDLRLPLKPQMDHVFKRLHRKQNELIEKGSIDILSPRLRKDKFIEYLRVWDAYCDGSSQNEIASILYPKIKNEYPGYHGNDLVRKACHAAEDLVNGGYLKIYIL